MRKAILLFVLLTLFGIPYLLAQGGFRITGQILSAEDNLPVIGVSVVEKGTANGVITDIDGNYSITVSKSPATLQYSYVGMKTVEKLFTAESWKLLPKYVTGESWIGILPLHGSTLPAWISRKNLSEKPSGVSTKRKQAYC